MKIKLAAIALISFGLVQATGEKKPEVLDLYDAWFGPELVLPKGEDTTENQDITNLMNTGMPKQRIMSEGKEVETLVNLSGQRIFSVDEKVSCDCCFPLFKACNLVFSKSKID